MSRRLGEQCWAAGLALAIGACCGCGTREYRQRMAAGLEWYAPSELKGTRVSIRVPKVFKQSFVERSAVDGKPVDPRRVKPAAVDLGKLSITYEALAPSADDKMAYYCYLGARELSGKEGGDPAGPMQQQLKEKFPNGTGNWEDVRYPTSEGQSLAWKKVRSTGPQEFYYVDKNGKKAYKQMPGTLELYLHQDAGCVVVMGWRVPTDLEKSTGFANLAALMAGSVTVREKK